MQEENYLTGVIEDIITTFGDGELISHRWLKKRCGLKEVNYEDYDNIEDFLKARETQQFEYMGLVERIRLQMLKENASYFKNERGDGYVILPAKDQAQYAYDRFIDKTKKLLYETNLIITNVRYVSGEQQAKDNDLRAKFASIKMLLNSIKKDVGL